MEGKERVTRGTLSILFRINAGFVGAMTDDIVNAENRVKNRRKNGINRLAIVATIKSHRCLTYWIFSKKYASQDETNSRFGIYHCTIHHYIINHCVCIYIKVLFHNSRLSKVIDSNKSTFQIPEEHGRRDR